MLTNQKILTDIQKSGIITVKLMQQDLNISKTSATRNFDKINKLYPGTVIKAKDLIVNGIKYGTGKPIRAISTNIYHQWLQEHYYKESYKDHYGLDDGSLFRKKLESKSKDELIEEIIDLHASLSKVRDSVFNKIDQEINKL